ncbi:disulfide bond formation protein B [Egibacter rhizosphaerae]|uniref:Disulfide bond formation protein B n=1 Tax=Egibacter rhizosphaerae TaxID=1670831 RepID=A0A411YDN7_9ACTN|nr:disulfide bond formation protein B [Egibacter rhizosphaerae]QBI19286.1 disulfide bond formation protein B [Egibacter rhizosphaerae]
MPDVMTMSTFFALLALAAAGLALGLAGARLVSPHRGWPAAREAVGDAALPVAAVIAAGATAGSLYYSDVVGFQPCPLCWYQRIAMYPLVILLGVAAVRRDAGVRWYAWPLTGIGAVIAIAHYLLEWLPAEGTVVCEAGGGCGVADFRVFGFVSLPFMALAGFAAVAALVYVAVDRDRQGAREEVGNRSERQPD